ncbi:MAG: hypothetical protein RIE87_01745 [Rhodospirillales bacterium]|tara:strand:- start:1327 stop:2670 length:1344 start_codon:yes stop_codon:yes gene_type:complete
MDLILIFSAGLAVLICGVECWRFRRNRSFTFLSAVNGLLLLGYCIPPFIVHFVAGSAHEKNIWDYRLYLFSLMERLNIPAASHVSVYLILGGAYVTLLAGYFAGTRLPVRRLDSRSLPRGGLLTAAAVMGTIATAALVVYVSQFDGLRDFLKSGMEIRVGRVANKWGYLHVLAELAMPAMLMAAGAAFSCKGKVRTAVIMIAAVLWTVAAARAVHAAGRFEVGSFLMIPILAWMFTLRSRRAAVLVFAIAAVLVLLIAMAPHAAFRDPLATLPRMLAHAGDRFLDTVLFILVEYSFPYIASAHTLGVVPNTIDFRYFIDIPLGFLYMLPSLSGVDTWPPMILTLHVKMLPWIPVDLVSFGYYSLGTVGVLITFAVFGTMLAVFDGWLTHSVGWLGQAFRAAWLFYLPFRLFYADPYASAQVGFGLITATVVLAGLAWWPGQKTRDLP